MAKGAHGRALCPSGGTTRASPRRMNVSVDGGERAGMRAGQIGRVVHWGGSVSERAARMHRTRGGITVHTPEIANDNASCNNWVQPELTPATFSTTRANGNHDVARSRRICVCWR